MMRRILLVVTVAFVMAAMMVFSAVPAFALDGCEAKDDKLECSTFELKLETNELKFEAPGCEVKVEVEEDEEDEVKDECPGV